MVELPAPSDGTCIEDDTWVNNGLEDPPIQNTGHTVVWTGDEMLVWGGGYGNSAARYDPLTDTWSHLSLKNAPPAGQVRSIKYCGDTYTVETADGKVEKIWEFNLRFKSDSSKLGPTPGKPVVVGAGMQGDRASVVFASPKEISDTIKQSCP